MEDFNFDEFYEDGEEDGEVEEEEGYDDEDEEGLDRPKVREERGRERRVRDCR